jgi:hypothetical protein
MSIRISEHRCAACNRTLDAVTAMDGSAEPPRIGDPTICLYCGTLLVYAPLNMTRVPGHDEAKELLSDRVVGPDLKKALAMWHFMNRMRGGANKPNA